MPTISQVAGRKHMRKAGRPTCRSSPTSRLSPARARMISKATLRRSADTAEREGESRSNTEGPSGYRPEAFQRGAAAPVFEMLFPKASPEEKQVPDCTAFRLLLSVSGQQKKLMPLRKMSQKSSAKKRFGPQKAGGELHSRKKEYHSGKRLARKTSPRKPSGKQMNFIIYFWGWGMGISSGMGQ